MKWRRKVTYETSLEDRFANSFYKTGFINEDIFDRDSRDIWKAFIRLMSNSNTSAIFTSLLIAYKEIPYSAELLQDLTVNSTKKVVTKGYDVVGDICVDTKLDYYKFYECVFIKSPYMYNINLRDRDCLYNTIKIIKERFSPEQGYTIIESSLQAINDAGHMAAEESSDNAERTSDLFIRPSKNSGEILTRTVIVPMLIDDSYYMIDGIRTYPIISEAYHYSTSRFGQKEFICKNNNSGKNFANRFSIILGYFDAAFLEDGDGPEIFYIKTSKKCFYNPLMFLNKHEAESLYKDVMAEPMVKKEVKKILQNTYNHYLENIDTIRQENKNLIPNIKVWRRNDSFFDEELEESFSDENFVVKKFNRRMIPKNMIKSLIMGFNNVRYYAFYGHMNDIYIMTKNRIANKSKSANREISSEETIRSMGIYATIRSNKDLCANYDNTNPYDVWARVSYKKYINPTAKDLKDADEKERDVSKSPPRDYLRYLTEEEYTLIDPTTVKSENTSGIVSSFTLFNHRKFAFRKADEL